MNSWSNDQDMTHPFPPQYRGSTEVQFVYKLNSYNQSSSIKERATSTLLKLFRKQGSPLNQYIPESSSFLEAPIKRVKLHETAYCRHGSILE